ncbi:MAG: mannose-1-phosphate guanylyltransferase, partial [Oscillospiraceae bacterium]|nr:mannose-1-phosphate guanylyltransferase [Oscillospiraceae bacterium]
YMPDLYTGLQPIANAYGTENFEKILIKNFPDLPAESIDFGIMEKAENIYTIPSSFGWDDVGNWLALERINATDRNGNLFDGDIISVDTRNCTVCADNKNNKTIALLGLDNLVIVDTPDALLICDKNSTQDIKKVLAEIRKQEKFNLL